MVKLNRTTEYGLIALRHISRKQAVDPAAITSAREIADCYGLPFEITAKTLQRLKEQGVIDSSQGARGGYTLIRSLNQITLAQFLEMMEGGNSVVACASLPGDLGREAQFGQACDYSPRCEIKGLMNDLNRRVHSFLSGISLNELAEPTVLTQGRASGTGATLERTKAL